MSGVTRSEGIVNAYCVSIDANHVTNPIIEEEDFFVGENKSVTLQLPYGMTLKLRDVVVLGELIIHPTDSACKEIAVNEIAENVRKASVGKFSMQNKDQYRSDDSRPKLSTRNLIHTGRVEMISTNLECVFHYVQKKRIVNNSNAIQPEAV